MSIISGRRIVRDFGTALSFDGGSGHSVNLTASAQYANMNTASFECWFNAPLNQVGSGGGNWRIFSVGQPSGTRNDMELFLISTTSASPLRFGAVVAGVGTIGVVSPIIWNAWNHVVCTNAGDGTGNAKIYVNGLLAGTGSGSTLTLGATPQAYIGRFVQSAANEYTGLIDEVVFYNRVLTIDEVQNRYFFGVYPTTGVIGRWNCNDGSGTTLTDQSGNGLNGTLTAGVTWTSNVVNVNRKVIT